MLTMVAKASALPEMPAAPTASTAQPCTTSAEENKAEEESLKAETFGKHLELKGKVKMASFSNLRT